MSEVYTKHNPRRPAVKQLMHQKWITVEEYRFNTYCVPAGFVFDGASIPRALWSFMNPYGRAFYPSLLHDYMYNQISYHYECGNYDEEDVENMRHIADMVFKELLGYHGVGKIRANMAYRAVRLFGSSHI